MVVLYPLAHWKASHLLKKNTHSFKSKNKTLPSRKDKLLVVFNLGFIMSHFGKSKDAHKNMENLMKIGFLRKV